MKKHFILFLTALTTAVGLNTARADDDVNTNFRESAFTVNEDGEKVYFSQGNLQAQPMEDGIYRFAPRQIDMIGMDNNKLHCTYEGFVDLFVYGHEASFIGNGVFDTNCGEADEFDSPTRRNSPMGYDEDFIDWGTTYSIANGGNMKWRTLTADEWTYLFFRRDNATGLFGFATVDDVNGLIVLPDDWTLPSGCEFVPASEKMTATEGEFTGNTTESVYTHNTYSYQTWQSMEAAGAVFLPAAGMRTKKVPADVGTAGYYWSSYKDENNGNNSLILSFNHSSFTTQASASNQDGLSVRLVRGEYDLTVKADPTEGGMVLENGNEITGDKMKQGDTKTLTVWEADGYKFAGWEITGDTEEETGSTIVAADTKGEYIFTMGYTATTLTAKFREITDDERYYVTIDIDGEGYVEIDGTAYYSGDIYEVNGEREIKFTAVADEGYEFVKWDDESTVNPRTINVNADMTVMPTFEEAPTYTVTVDVNDAAGGYVTDEDNKSVDGTTITGLLEGETVVLTAVKYDDYNFTGWTVTDGVTYTTDGDKITITIGKSDVTVMANFELIPTYTVTVDVNDAAGGYVTDEDNNSVDGTTIIGLLEGETVVLTAVKYDDYNFTGWTVTDGVTYTTDGDKITITIGKSDVTVMANFELIPTYTVTVDVNDAAGGYVTDEDNKSVDGTTITGLLEGETVVLTAVKYDDYNFTGWTVTDGVTYTTDGDKITITIGKSDVTVMANFVEEDKNTLSVVVTPANSGTVYLDGIEMTVPAELNEGDVVILTAFPAENYEVEGMTVTAGDGTIEETADGWRFTMGTESSVVTATFKRVHVHTWSAWDYEWAEDYSTCTATRVCEDDPEHTQTEISSSVTSATTPATCEEAGVIVYTATFEGEGLETQVSVEIPALGHDWGAATYTWSADYMTCTATRVCNRDASHVEEETAAATVTVVDGVTVYTVTFVNEAFEPQTYRPHLDITLSKYGFLSLYSDKAYIVPSDLIAVIYTGISGRDLTNQQLTVIPAYTGVVFRGTANKTYTLYETTTTDDYSSVNMLNGSLTDQEINDGNVHYILTRLEGTDLGGLYWPHGTVRGVGAFTNHAGKAYLTIPASAGVAPRYFTLQGRACEEGTAIDETEAEGDGKYYDILGREVREPQPQQIYIHNGKKVLYGE